MNDDIRVDLHINDISRSHRIGPKKEQKTRSTKPRPLIFRLVTMRKRMEVFRNKKNLKGKQIAITESLTTMKYKLLLKANDKFGMNNVWTSEGRIFTKKDHKLILISSEADLLV